MRGHLTSCSLVEEAGGPDPPQAPGASTQGEEGMEREDGGGGSAWSPCSRRGHSLLIRKAAANVT